MSPEPNGRSWTRQQLANALNDVHENLMSVRSAADKHSIPLATLQRYHKGQTTLEATRGPSTALACEQEIQLLDYIQNMHRIPLTCSRDLVCVKAADLEAATAQAAGQKPRWPEGIASDKWWKGFKTRHNLVLRATAQQDSDRSASLIESSVKDFFKQYKGVIGKYLHGEDIRVLNFDETGLQQEGYEAKGVVPKGTKGSIERNSGSAAYITKETITCIAAATPNHVLAPVFVIKGTGKRVRLNPLAFTKDTIPNAKVLYNEKSPFINGALMLQYLDHIAEHVPGGVSPSKPLLVICDGHSSRTDAAVVEKARALGIDILLFPGRTSELLQPWDQFFNAFKAELGKRRTREYLKGKSVSKQKFLQLVGEAWQKTATKEALSKCFSVTGIYPVDEQRILDKLPKSRSSPILPEPNDGDQQTLRMAANTSNTDNNAATGNDAGTAHAANAMGTRSTSKLAPAVANVLRLPQHSRAKSTRPSKVITHARMITSEEYQRQDVARQEQQLQQKARRLAEMQAVREAKRAQRQADREARQHTKQLEQQAKQAARVKKAEDKRTAAEQPHEAPATKKRRAMDSQAAKP